MSDLTEFLLARIAEDERAARKLATTDRRPVLSLATTANHPERLLLECGAKRQIVEEYTWHVAHASRGVASYEATRQAEQTCKYLAAIYADHPDYRNEWRP